MTERGFVLPSPTLVMAGVIVVLSITNLVLYKLWQGKVDEYANYRASVVAAQKQAEADAENERLERQRILADTARDWSAVLDWVNSHPRTVRVLPARGCLPEGGAISAPAGSDAGVPPGILRSHNLFADC